MEDIRGLSLFSNIGVAEAYLKEIGVKIEVANELLKNRAKLYQDIYPETEMICGDITDEIIFQKVLNKSKLKKCNFIIATPPCQGMSTAGRQDKNDVRNYLITYAIRMIIELMPKYVLLENVPQQLKTTININGELILIPKYIKNSLKEYYYIKEKIVNALDYGVPQMRQRSIYLMTRKDLNIEWDFISEKEKTSIRTLKEAIGDLPSLDPFIQGFNEKELLEYFPDFLEKKKRGLAVSKWHYPPVHKIRHIEVMKYTPEGKSALDNTNHYPKNKKGEKVKGFKNTYRRQVWDKPAYTITTYNGAICSQDNVHPGRYIKKDQNGDNIFSDPRVFSIYELMILMSLPKDWNLPDWPSDSLLRHTLGEGIPPLIVKKLVENLMKELKNE